MVKKLETETVRLFTNLSLYSVVVLFDFEGCFISFQYF